MALYVKFWGTRGSIPTPGFRTKKYGGNTPCVEIRSDETTIICDGGSGLRELGLNLASRGMSPVVGHMFFSHTHWDHIQGFPFFVPFFVPGNTFYVYGTASGDQSVHDLLSGQMKSDYFPVDFSELHANILPADLGGGTKTIGDIEVRFFQVRHPGGCFAYSFTQGSRKVVYATDNEIDLELQNREESLSVPSAERKVPEAFTRFVERADLLIADGQYTDEEYRSKVGWGHARATTLVDLAAKARVKQVAVFHHDPLQSDHDVVEKIEACRARASLRAPWVMVFGAREGVELRIE
jgi:phosphoribosyl 1,2-cyclic phosphodiesterase